MITGLAVANDSQQSLHNLDARISGLMGKKKDFISDTRNLEMKVVETDQKKKQLVMDVANQGEFPIRPLAHDQIGNHIAIPSKYYDRMATEAPELLAFNVNHWMHNTGNKAIKRMVRTLEGNIRAFLSNAYQRIENEEIFRAALPVLLTDPSLRIVSAEVTERRLYIQCVTERITGEVKKGDPVQAGVIISNSEVGAGSVSVAPVVWRLVCLNGMVSPDSRYRANHVGRRVDSNEALWARDTQKADDRAILLKVRDMTRAALDEVHFARRLDKMRALTEMEITGDPAEAVQVLASKVGTSDTESASILSAFIKGKDLSAWGLLNAVTYQAHGAKDYDRAVEFATEGGKLLDLSAKDWKEVLDAKPSEKKAA